MFRNQVLKELADDLGIVWDELNTPEACDRLHVAIQIGFQKGMSDPSADDIAVDIGTDIVCGYGLGPCDDCPDTREKLFKTYDRETIRRCLDDLCEIVDTVGLVALREADGSPVLPDQVIVYRQVYFGGDENAYGATLADVYDGLMSAGAIACWYEATAGGLTDEGRKLLAYLEKSQA